MPSGKRGGACTMESSEDRTALQGKEERLFKMVSKGATSTLWSKWLQPPLEQAIGEGDVDLVLSLLKAGADADSGWRGCRGWTLLYAAAKGGSEKIVSALLKAGGRSDLNAVSGNKSMSALHRAVFGGHIAAARVLMVAGAGVNLQDENGRTALHLAVMRGDRELVECVLTARAHVDVQNRDGYTPLHQAANGGDCTIISMLLDAGANVMARDKMGYHVLHVAVQRGRIEAAKALLKAGADPNVGVRLARSLSPLRFAIGSSEMIRLLVQHGASPDACSSHGYTPLHSAAAEGGCDSGVIDALIEAGIKVEARTSSTENMLGGQTPLHRAAYFRSLLGMDALLRHGADIHAKDDKGRSPLHLVCTFCPDEHSIQAADFLLRRGADETATDNNGDTATQYIIEGTGSAKSLKRLLAGAPADKAWRRRALLVLCRAFPDRLQHRCSKGEAAKALCQGGGHAESLLWLLVGASDRAWLRRAWLVLCRAFPYRLQRRNSEGKAAKVLCQGEAVRTEPAADRGDEGEQVLVRVVEVVGETIFRNIVGFL